MGKNINIILNKKDIVDKFTISKSTIYIIFAILCVLYIWHLGYYPLFNPDEGRYAEIPREMLFSGNFITPHLNGVEYFEKPALQYWITAISMLIFGENEFAVRLFPALCALGGVFCTYYLGTKMFNRKTGILASIILATSFLYLIIGSLNILDMPVSFFITLCMVSFYQFGVTQKSKFLYIFYASMAFGVLTKGLVAIVFAIAIAVIYAICTKQFKLIWKLFSPIGISIFLIICVPWFYLVCRDNPDFFYFFFIHEHFLRYTTTTHHRYAPAYFFIPCIILGIFPWTGFLFASVSLRKIWARLKNSFRYNQYIYLIIWFSIVFIFYSLSDSKLVPYIIPCFPPLAILIASRLANLDKDNINLKIPLIINAVIAFCIVLALTITTIKSDFITIREFILFGSPLICVVLISNIISLILWFKYKNAYQIVGITVISAILFSFSVQPIMTEVAEHRSGKDVAQMVNLWKKQDTLIICYQDYLQDLPFYTKSRIALYDYYGELEFGSKHESGKNWFLNKTDLINTWQNNENVILVVPQKRKEDCLETLNIDLDKVEYKDFERYIVIKR